MAAEAALLPIGWSSHVDPRSQRVFYHNAATSVSTWNLPAPQVEDAYTVEAACSACNVAVLRRAIVDRQRPVALQRDQSVRCHGTVHCACGAATSVSLQISVEQQRQQQQREAQKLPQQQPVDESERGLLEASSDTVELAADVFSEYRCRSLDFGRSHPSDNITESASMAGIALPPADYPLRQVLDDEVIEGGLLSSLQLEGVLYACQRHSRFLPSSGADGQPARAGFFLGDGAGVGKGRQVAAIILDNFARGRKKHVWFSVSTDLRLDAERDLRDIGATGCQVIDGCKALEHLNPSTTTAGVVFSTYATLVSAVSQQSTVARGGASGAPASKRQKTRRVDQLIEWCGGDSFDGCLIFDECHKAKNYKADSEGGTKVGAAVVELQKALPAARVVYCSATGVTDLENMAYMTRLGLWGEGTQFTTFTKFRDEIKNRGSSSLEMLAIELKGSGTYVSRALGFKSAEFDVLEASLSADDIACYDAATLFWDRLRSSLTTALEQTQRSTSVMRGYWSAHQRFFKQLCISMKVPKIVAEAQQALLEGHCVVIGLQTTGESALEDYLAKAKSTATPGTPVTFQGFISVARFIVKSFIENHFPTTMPALKPDEIMHYHSNGVIEYADGRMRLADGTIQPSATSLAEIERQRAAPKQHLVQLKSQLLVQAESLALPPSPLDELIDKLGGPQVVAEMTGRKGRLVRTRPGCEATQYVERGKAEEDRDNLNVQECRDFQAGRKLVGIISDAASTGISLHASVRAANSRRRVHITMELPWSADKAIQQLGRSHRSNQHSAPHYKLVISALSGERRFAAAVARRLESLGALTRGDRRAATGSADFSAFNVDTSLGLAALKKMLIAITINKYAPEGVDLISVLKGNDEMAGKELTQVHEDLCETIRQIGLLDEYHPPVSRFLNRLLGARVGMQSVLFGYFTAIFDADIEQARRTGTFDEGVSDLKGKVALEGEAVVYKNVALNLETKLYSLQIDRGLSFADGKDLLQRARAEDEARALRTQQRKQAAEAEGIEDDEDDRCCEDENEAAKQMGWYRSKKKVFGAFIHLLAIEKRVDGRSKAVVSRPTTGTRKTDTEWSEIHRNYRKYEDSDAAALKQVQADWDEEYSKGEAADAKVKRRYTVGVLTGSVTPFWSTLQAILTHDPDINQAESVLQVVRVNLPTGGRIVGVKWPTRLADIVSTRLKAFAEGHATSAPSIELPSPVDENALAVAKDDRFVKFEALLDPTEVKMTQELMTAWAALPMFQVSSKRLLSKVKGLAASGVGKGKGKKALRSFARACAQHPVEAQGYAAGFISKFVPDFVDTTPPVGVDSVPHARMSVDTSTVKQDVVSPTASPVASPTASSAPFAAPESLAAAAVVADGKAHQDVEGQKRPNWSSSFLALSQRNQKKIFGASDSPQQAKGSAAKPMPTFASFFAQI